MLCQIFGVIGLLVVGGVLVWAGVWFSGFFPDLIRAVAFYRKHKENYDGYDDIDKLKRMQTTIIGALEDHLKLNIYSDTHVGYSGPDLVKLWHCQRELEEIVEERREKKIRKFKKQEAEKKAKKRKKK